MSGSPLISVIMPTINAVGEVRECMKALGVQKFRDFEILVADAGSNDGTLDEVASSAASWQLDLRIESCSDTGVYDAMNRGIGLSSGHWLYFIGADDRLCNADVLPNVSKILKSTRADLVYGDVIMKSDGRRVGGAVTLDELLFERNICHQAIFYRRSLLERMGGYSLRYPVWADWDLNLRCFKTPGVGVEWIDQVIAIYNDTGGLSSEEDPVLVKELPATLLRDAQHTLFKIRAKRSYRLGKRLFGWLD